MIESLLNKKNNDLIQYFFGGKLEKIEYISFLKSLLNYFSQKSIFIDLLYELSSDIYNAEQNNVNSKYIVDKYILKIIK
jgi:hypothetical protein